MKISGHIIQAYLICPRQAWLMSRNIIGDQYNDFMMIGRLLSEETYKREKKEIKIGGNIIDVLKSKDGVVTLIEVKKSSKAIEASMKQLLFYMYSLRHKVKNITGEIRVPTEKKVVKVELTDESILEIENLTDIISCMLEENKPPALERNKYCKTCSQLEFCWA